MFIYLKDLKPVACDTFIIYLSKVEAPITSTHTCVKYQLQKVRQPLSLENIFQKITM